MSFLAERLRLSPRETQIVLHLFTASKESTIAAAVGMSPHTLRTHVERLYRKLRVSTRTQLVVRLYEGFLELVADAGAPLEPICPRRARGQCPFQS